MEAFTFIHKQNKEIIKFSHIETNDSEFGDEFFFTDSEFAAPWITFNKDDIDFLLKKKDIHPQFSIFYNIPSKEIINLDDYEVHSFNI